MKYQYLVYNSKVKFLVSIDYLDARIAILEAKTRNTEYDELDLLNLEAKLIASYMGANAVDLNRILSEI